VKNILSGGNSLDAPGEIGYARRQDGAKRGELQTWERRRNIEGIKRKRIAEAENGAWYILSDSLFVRTWDLAGFRVRIDGDAELDGNRIVWWRSVRQ
jgi:hypothetical protein